jgi:hypothetical protein
MDEGGSRNGDSPSEEAQCRGSLGRAPLLGTLEDMLRKAPDMGISLHRGPFMSKENFKSGGKVHIPGNEGGLQEQGMFLRGESMRGT